MAIFDFFFGRTLANREHEKKKLSWFEGVPAMGLDGLGSASYGPEAALTILMPLGAASLVWIGAVMAPIVFLLVVLYFSYRQTVVAYRTSGGAYTVSKQNLGMYPSLLAASAIMIDYVLNVAVGISAGVGALTSSVPSLHPYTVWLCLGILGVIIVANMRGTPEASLVFAVPTYVYIASFVILVGIAVFRTLVTGGHPHAIVAPPPLPAATQSVSLWLLLRAFAAGCTAMTGVEAVSNAVGAFKPPVTKRAHQTLTIICGTLGILLAGVAVAVYGYRLAAMSQTSAGYQSVMSQLTAAIAGRGTVYYIAMASLLAVLCLSANTSFVAFPRLARYVAEDRFLPVPFALPDRRLVYSAGVGFLAISAGALLVIFGGITDRLIPLFAIGAFLTFTMSQIGMVMHWRRESGHGARRRLAINALGAAITIVALVIIVVAKFLEGAWIVIVAIPLIFALLLSIRRYYERLDEQMRTTPSLQLEETLPPTILVVIERRTKMTDRALRFAMTLSPDVIAVHLLNLGGPENEEEPKRIKCEWEEEVIAPLTHAGVKPPRLVLIPAPYRKIHEPLLDFIGKLDLDTPGRSVAVLIPEIVFAHWWERFLHPRRGEQLRHALLTYGGPRLNLVIAPWRRLA